MKNLFIGIDFSKEKVDVAIISAEGLVETSARVFTEFKNSVSGYKQLVKWVDKNSNGIDPSMWLFCGENTGDYSKPLCNHLSADGFTFDRAYLLRSGKNGDYPAQRYTGKAKTLGYSYPKAMVHGGYLYVSYSTNKDDAQYTRIPVSSISCGISLPNATTPYSISGKTININSDEVLQLNITDLSGRVVYNTSGADSTTVNLTFLPKGIYIITAKTLQGVLSQKIMLK